MCYWETYSTDFSITNKLLLNNNLNKNEFNKFTIFLGTGRIPFHNWNFEENNKFYKTTSYRFLIKFKNNLLRNTVYKYRFDVKLLDTKDKILNDCLLKIQDKKIDINEKGEIELYSKFYFNIISYFNKDKNKNLIDNNNNDKLIQKISFKLLVIIYYENEKYITVSPNFFIFAKKPKNENENKYLSNKYIINNTELNNINLKYMILKSQEIHIPNNDSLFTNILNNFNETINFNENNNNNQNNIFISNNLKETNNLNNLNELNTLIDFNNLNNETLFEILNEYNLENNNFNDFNFDNF